MSSSATGHGKYPKQFECAFCELPVRHKHDSLVVREDGKQLCFHVGLRCYSKWRRAAIADARRQARDAERLAARERALQEAQQARPGNAAPPTRVFQHCPTCGTSKLREVQGSTGKLYRVRICRHGHFAIQSPSGITAFPEAVARAYAEATHKRRADAKEITCTLCPYPGEGAADLLEHMMHVHALPPEPEPEAAEEPIVTAVEVAVSPPLLPLPLPDQPEEERGGLCRECDRPAIFVGRCAEHAQRWADASAASHGSQGAGAPQNGSTATEREERQDAPAGVGLPDSSAARFLDEVVARLETRLLDQFERRIAHLEHRLSALATLLGAEEA